MFGPGLGSDMTNWSPHEIKRVFDWLKEEPSNPVVHSIIMHGNCPITELVIPVVVSHSQNFLVGFKKNFETARRTLLRAFYVAAVVWIV